MPDPQSLRPYVVLMPVYNDWTSATRMIHWLGEVAQTRLAAPLVLVLVDDGSTEPFPAEAFEAATLPAGIVKIDRVHLRCNLGHQRAIAIGLCYIDAAIPCRGVIVMDSDGEDDPGDIPLLIECFEQQGDRPVVLAKRSKRTEGAVFIVCYTIYRRLFRVLTGFSVRSGNYSLVGQRHVRALVAASDLWNHFGATVFKLRLPTTSVATARRSRIDGRSKVGFNGLIVHGFSAISVFLDRGCVRVMIGSGLALLLALLMLLVVPWAPRAWRGEGLWALTAVAILGLQIFVSATVLLFVSLRQRDGASVIPVRDYQVFVDRVQSVSGMDASHAFPGVNRTAAVRRG